MRKESDGFTFFNTSTGRLLLRLDLSEYARYMDASQAFSRDGAYYVYLPPQGNIKVVDLRSRVQREWPNNQDSSRWAVNNFEFAGISDSTLYLAQVSAMVFVGDRLRTYTLLEEMDLSSGKRDTVFFKPARFERLKVMDRFLLIDFEVEQEAIIVGRRNSFDKPKEAALLDRSSRTFVARVPGSFPYQSVSLLAGTRFLYLSPQKAMPVQFDMANCQSVSFHGRNNADYPLAFTRDGKLFTGSKLLDIATGKTVHAFTGGLEDWSISRDFVVTRNAADSSFTLYRMLSGDRIAVLPKGSLEGENDIEEFAIASTADSVVSAHLPSGNVRSYAGNYFFHNDVQALLITQTEGSSGNTGSGWNYNDRNTKKSEPYDPGLLRLFDLNSGAETKRILGEPAGKVYDGFDQLLYLLIKRNDSTYKNPIVTAVHIPSGNTRQFRGSFVSCSKNGLLIVRDDEQTLTYQLGITSSNQRETVNNQPSVWQQPGLFQYFKNADSSYYAGVFADGSVRIRSADGRYLSRSFVFNMNTLKSIVFQVSTDLNWAVLSLVDSTYLIDLSGNLGTRVLKQPAGEFVDGIRFDASGARFEIITTHFTEAGYSSSNYTYTLWDTRDAAVLLRGSTPIGVPGAFVYSDDGRVAAMPEEGMIAIYDLSERRFLYHYLGTDSLNGLVLDSAFRYDGPEAARQTLHLTCGTEIIELAQVKDELWQPNLAERLIRGERINGPAISDLDICGLTPVIEDRSSGRSYRFRVRPRRGGLGESVLYVNDIEVRRYAPSALRRYGNEYELLVAHDELEKYIVDGQENTVSVKAFTKNNDIQSRGIIASAQGRANAAAPKLFAVMVGVSDYKGDALDLKYAAKDAADLSEVLALSARKLLRDKSGDNVYFYNLNTGPGR
ncbi:MAG: hypothetical protein EOO15_19385, partial [Chitinophagaceae bacterium]